MKTIIEKIPVILFVASLCFFSAFLGMAIWGKKLFPYEHISEAWRQIKVLLPDEVLSLAGMSKEQIKTAKRPSYVVRIRHHSPGTTVHIPEAVSPGVTLLTSHWPEHDWEAGLKLIDTEGNTLHQWVVNTDVIWPTKSLVEANVHGSYLFPNGDVLFNVEYQGLVRLNSCGEVMWATHPRIKTHHSVFRAENGNFWVAGYNRVEKDNSRTKDFPAFTPPFGEDVLREYTPDGELVNEISLLETIYNSDYKHLLWHYRRFGEKKRRDILHLNDVELLSSELARDFPLFDAGDILISSRELSLVAVLNPAGEIKWAKPGEFTNQHDPDFEPGGWITIFDNRMEYTPTGEHMGGTRIVAINPTTDKIRQLYPATNNSGIFYSPAGGKHQLLENGNRLITEAQAPRVLEVTSEGELVWEHIPGPYDDEWVSEILEGTRYPNISTSDVKQWPCSL